MQKPAVAVVLGRVVFSFLQHMTNSEIRVPCEVQNRVWRPWLQTFIIAVFASFTGDKTSQISN